MTVTKRFFEDYLNSFLPKLFYEIEYDERGVTVRVPDLVKDKVLSYLVSKLPYMHITVKGDERCMKAFYGSYRL